MSDEDRVLAYVRDKIALGLAARLAEGLPLPPGPLTVSEEGDRMFVYSAGEHVTTIDRADLDG